jgi:iron complex outermembrane receptor protein
MRRLLAWYPARAIGTAATLSILTFCHTAWADNTDTTDTPAADLTEMSMEQLMSLEVTEVYSASRFKQSVTEAPASVTIITSDDIKRFGYRTLADTLRSVRGFYISYDRNYHYLGSRGISRQGDYNSRFLLLIDGHRYNDTIYNTAAIGTDFPLDMGLIDRIEVVRGPSSSLYGTNAMLGVINVITRPAAKVGGTEASIGVGDQERWSGRLTHGRQLQGGGEFLLSASGYSSVGEQDLSYQELVNSEAYPGFDGSIDDDMDRDRSYSFFGRMSWDNLTLTALHGWRDKRIPTGSFETVPNDPGTHSIDSRSYLDLSWETALAGTTVMARAYYDQYRFKGYYTYLSGDTLADGTYRNVDDVTARWWGTDVQASRSILPWLQLTGGGEFRHNLKLDQINSDSYPGGPTIASRDDNIFWALFAQGELRPHSSVIVNVGLRYDRYPDFGGQLSPRAAVIYTPTGSSTLKLIYGEAFRAPNAYERSYQDTYGTFTLNPDLQPETIRSYEAVYEQAVGDHYRLSLSTFHNSIKDLISDETIADGSKQFQNISGIEAQGGGIEIEGRWGNGFVAQLGYTYVDASEEDTGQHLNNSPRNLGFLKLSAPLYRRSVFAGLEMVAESRRETTEPGIETAGYLLTNLTISSNGLLPGLEASASVYNLFDKEYETPSTGTPEHAMTAIGQDGRTFRLLVTYRF